MKKRPSFTLQLLVFCLFPQVADASEMAIKKHLTDATKLNRERAFLYAKESKGLSLPLSYELIAMENLAVFVTHHMDEKAKIYMKNGIGLFNDDLVDMKLTPKYQSTFQDNNSPKDRVSLDIKNIKAKWKHDLNDGHLNDIYMDAVILLEHGELKEVNQNCLTRHFVESIARSLLNHEGHREKSKLIGLEDPQPLLLSFLKTQIATLSWAYSLDKRAYTIQRKNIPLFCQDVPAIPYK